MQNHGMICGYARVSTDAKDLGNLLVQLKSAGRATIYREKVSGATADRPQLKTLLATLAHGDVVRDTTDLLVIARHDLLNAWF